MSDNKSIISYVSTYIKDTNNPIVIVVKSQWNKFTTLEDYAQLTSFGLILLFLMLFGIFQYLIYYFVCIGYPVYGSLMTCTTNSKLNFYWITYWIVFTGINFVEEYSLLHYVPYYTTAKMLFLFICFMPKPKSIVLYTKQYNLNEKIYNKCLIYLNKVHAFFKSIKMDIEIEDEQ
jgi:hypothetical protein